MAIELNGPVPAQYTCAASPVYSLSWFSNAGFGKKPCIEYERQCDDVSEVGGGDVSVVESDVSLVECDISAVEGGESTRHQSCHACVC